MLRKIEVFRLFISYGAEGGEGRLGVGGVSGSGTRGAEAPAQGPRSCSKYDSTETTDFHWGVQNLIEGWSNKYRARTSCYHMYELKYMHDDSARSEAPVPAFALITD